jgi:hypothetical protein
MCLVSTQNGDNFVYCAKAAALTAAFKQLCCLLQRLQDQYILVYNLPISGSKSTRSHPRQRIRRLVTAALGVYIGNLLLFAPVAYVQVEGILELRGALKGEAEGVLACNNRLYRFQYCLLIAREIAVSNALETREDLVLLRRLDVVNNVDECTQRSLFTPVGERFLLVLNQDLS